MSETPTSLDDLTDSALLDAASKAIRRMESADEEDVVEWAHRVAKGLLGERRKGGVVAMLDEYVRQREALGRRPKHLPACFGFRNGCAPDCPAAAWDCAVADIAKAAGGDGE